MKIVIPERMIVISIWLWNIINSVLLFIEIVNVLVPVNLLLEFLRGRLLKTEIVREIRLRSAIGILILRQLVELWSCLVARLLICAPVMVDSLDLVTVFTSTQQTTVKPIINYNRVLSHLSPCST